MKLSYKNIKVSKNEDLNIRNHTTQILKYCWYNVERFPTERDIEEAMGYAPRGLRYMIASHKLPNRMTLRYDLKLKQYGNQKAA